MLELRFQTRFQPFVAMLLLFVTGCATSVNKQAFVQSAPREIRLVVGYDIYGITGTYLPGLWGLLAQRSEQVRPRLEKEMVELALDRLKSQLADKGYTVTFVSSKYNEWHLLENLSGGEKAYRSLIEKYDLRHFEGQPGAILFVEWMLQPRLWGLFVKEVKMDELTLDNFKPKFAKSKIWLYGTSNGVELFRTSVQKGYSETTGKGLKDAYTQILDLSKIPSLDERRSR